MALFVVYPPKASVNVPALEYAYFPFCGRVPVLRCVDKLTGRARQQYYCGPQSGRRRPRNLDPPGNERLLAQRLPPSADPRCPHLDIWLQRHGRLLRVNGASD